MEREDHESGVDNISVDPSSSSVNNLILDYYKKFGRKRDLEQFFSLSTAQSEIRDPTGTFWRKMKSQDDSSDSGEKKSESSTELCRISIKCSIPEPSSLQQGTFQEHQNSDSESPPIVTEEVASQKCRNSDDESIKSDDSQSQRSNDAALDTSMNKPHSPTSSVTSQRKLEWDSLADVGYANESDRKTSASSLSTLERLALSQQYSHNDSKLNMNLGPPTSHSTPVEEVEIKSKGKKGLIKKTTKIYQKDIDLVELNLPQISLRNLPQAVSVNLSKHICFNVEKDGGINIDNIKKDISVSPEKNVETLMEEKQDKKNQTSPLLNKDKITSVKNDPTKSSLHTQKFPVLISLNSLKHRNRKRKFRIAKKNLRNRNKLKTDNDNLLKGKTAEQVSEAESFEYMPGHIYNQNRLKINQTSGTYVGNKSSLESSAGLTTDSSKGSKHSFTKDLEKSINFLKTVLQHNNDSTLKKKLIKEVVQRLIKSKYRDDESSTDFLSGLSFNSKIIGKANHTTTSTSDSNNTSKKTKLSNSKKSHSNAIASTSQSAPNLTSFSNSQKRVTSNFVKPISLSNTDSDMSGKEKKNTDLEMTRLSSEEFYKKYLEALKREQLYKKHLKIKEHSKQKLVSSETAFTQLVQADLTTQSKLKSLIKDLTRNNYNDGSGDASKLEGHSNSNVYIDPHILLNNQRSHSVFTLSSGHSDGQNKNPRLKNIIKSAIYSSSKAGCSKNEHHYCCCPYHSEHAKVEYTDSSVQVNIECNKPPVRMEPENVLQRHIKCTKCKKESPRNIAKVVSDSETGDLKYICVCSDETRSEKVGQNILVYKCSRLVNKSVQLGDSLTRSSSTENEKTQETYTHCDQNSRKPKVTLKQNVSSIDIPQNTKSSQTNVDINLMAQYKSSVKSIGSQFSDSTNEVNIAGFENGNPKLFIQEAIRSIQTDISINPRLSDPCLSDINIINDNECVKLVREQYKEISKSNSDNNTETYSNPEKSQVFSSNSLGKVMSKISTENIHQTRKSLDCAYIAQFDKVVQSELDHIEYNQNENFTDHFTIPIQGTNMTLKVNLDTTESDNNKLNNIAIKSQGVVTEKTDVAEQFTSIREDCTKSVQCCDENLLQHIKNKGNERNVSDKSSIKNEEPLQSLNTCAVITCLDDKNKCNTYPQNSQGYLRKPLLRTNTDISNFENLYLPQFELQKYNKPTNKQEFSDDYREVLTEPTESNQNQQQISHNRNSSIYSTTKTNFQTPSPNCTNCINQKVPVNQLIKPQKCTACSNQKVNDHSTMPYNNETQPEECKVCSTQNVLTDQLPVSYHHNQSDKSTDCSNQKVVVDQFTKSDNQNQPDKSTECSNQKVVIAESTKLDNQNRPDKYTDFSSQKVIIDQSTKPNTPNQIEKCTSCFNQKVLLDEPTKPIDQNQPEKCTACSSQSDFTDQFIVDNQNHAQNITTFQLSQSDQVTKSHDQNNLNDCQTCNQTHLTSQVNKPKQNLSKKYTNCAHEKDSPHLSKKSNNQHQSGLFLSNSSKCSKTEGEGSKSASNRGEKSRTQSKTSTSESDSHLDFNANSDPLLDMIEGITKRYSKKDIEKSKRKKCFKEIMNVLNYLLDTEESADDRTKKSNNTCSSNLKQDEIPEKVSTETDRCPSKTFVDKGVQLSTQSKLNKCRNSDSSEIAVTSEFPTTSSDSATCKLLNKIKKECDKYHQRRCKSHNGLKACETSSTTSVSCEQCKRVHHCYCLRHKCKTHKIKSCGEKQKKKCIAYNLILQTSDSIVSEETVAGCNRPLKSIIIKVPSKRKQGENVPFKEMAAKFERNLPNRSPRSPCKAHRSRSLPNESEMSSTEEFLRKPQTYTVREYLERNRPDFVAKSSKRQDCLKTINEMRAHERNTKRKLLSLQLAKQKTLSALTDEELRRFAKQLSEELRRKKVAPKFISEREMKKHSEKIYKSLPEVTRKKDELKKENIKKTNLLMANIFKKNLQKKTLRGSVNLSNYSTVIKI